MKRPNPIPFSRRCLAVLLSAMLLGQGAAAQVNLPALGDSVSADVSIGAEKKLGDQVMRQIRPDPDYIDDPLLLEYAQNTWQPLVNAARKPGEWQTYDIVFEAPRFEGDKLVKPARVTVFHNGVLVHHAQELIGAAAHRTVGKYAPHGEAPLRLQDHGNPVRFRNVWIRRLGAAPTAK